MSLILALPTKQRVIENVVCGVVASAVSAVACVATTTSTVQAAAQPSASSARVACHSTPLQAVAQPQAPSIRQIICSTPVQVVAPGLSSVSVVANYSSTINVVAQPTARYALIDATGEAGVCNTVASISAASSRTVNHSTPLQAVISPIGLISRISNHSATCQAIADASSPVARHVNHTAPVTAVAKPFIEQGVIRYVIDYRAGKEPESFTLSDPVTFDVTSWDYIFEVADSVGIDIHNT